LAIVACLAIGAMCAIGAVLLTFSGERA
jgi:hypothetical protein